MQIMVSADETRPVEGSGQINAKTKTAGNRPEKRKRKGNQKTGQKPAQQVQEPVQELVAKSDTLPEAGEPLPEAREPVELPAVTAESLPDATSAEESAPIAPGEPEDSSPVSVQAITDAYGSYTRKSIEQTSSFFEQLAGTRSLNKAFELHTEFAQAAFDTFVDESRKIREMHRELAKQRLQSFEGFVMGRRAAR